jgi:hypothetical protein
MMALQVPRADRVLFEYDEMAAPMLTLPSPKAEATRTPEDFATRARVQRAALAAIDRLEPAARRGELGRAAIRRAVDGAAIPGMPTHLLDFDPSEMVEIREVPPHPPVPGGDP